MMRSIPSIIEPFRQAKLFRMSKQSETSESVLAVARAAAAFGAAAGAVDDAAADAFGVNRTDLRMIGILHARGALAAGQLAASCGLSPAATSTAIQRLALAGYVNRDSDSDDRRRAVVSVTASAAQRLEEIYGPVGKAGMAQLAEYDREQLALLADFLRRGEELQRTQAARIRVSQRE
jgi:DNA-binding MarR family transcriptional regulator